MSRIAVFSANLSYSVRKGIVEIDRAIPGLSWLVILHSPARTPKRLLRNQWTNLRRNGWRWIPYEAADLVRRFASRGAAPVQPHSPGADFTPEALRGRANLRISVHADIHAPDALEEVRRFEPDLGISLAAPILKPSLFSLPRLGTVNLHKGRVPEYRGMPPAFWELWNDESSVGCTVHRVAEKLDTGDVVVEAAVPRSKFSTVGGLQIALDELGVVLMRDAVRGLLEGSARLTPQRAGGRTNRKPTLAQVRALELKLGSATAGSRVKRAGKSAALAALRTADLASLRRWIPPRITVLLFHRVTDEVRDNLSVGVEQFERQMALLRAHCQPMSLEQVLASSSIASSRKPLVAVTFDDGYLDNYTNAVPILERHCIPAAFFVSTGIVDSDRRFPHDVRRGNPPIPVMSWDQLRDMRDRGFTIGSHSVTHIDCAAEPADTVRQELVRSKEDLARELGCLAPVFAYPYGGRSNMTSERLEMVREAGYVACLSAYGGTNVGRVERFNVLRRGIHWEFDDRAFLLECQGVM